MTDPRFPLGRFSVTPKLFRPAERDDFLDRLALHSGADAGRRVAGVTVGTTGYAVPRGRLDRSSGGAPRSRLPHEQLCAVQAGAH